MKQEPKDLSQSCLDLRRRVYNDSATLESRDWVRAEYARIAAERAYRQASIQNPRDPPL